MLDISGNERARQCKGDTKKMEQNSKVSKNCQKRKGTHGKGTSMG